MVRVKEFGIIMFSDVSCHRPSKEAEALAIFHIAWAFFFG